MRFKFLLYCLLITASFLIISCNSQNRANSFVLKETISSLQKSNIRLQDLANYRMAHLNSKTYDPMWAERARPWMEKAKAIWTKTNDLNDYLERAKINLGITIDSLHDRLHLHKVYLSKVDTSLYKQFKSSIDSLPIFNNLFTDQLAGEFRNALITKLQVDLTAIEYDLITYCNSNVPGYQEGYAVTIPLINQNYSHLKPADELEITVGLGFLNYPTYPRVLVNGDSLSYLDGMYKYKLQVPEAHGLQRVPIKIQYFDHSRGLITINKELTYYID